MHFTSGYYINLYVDTTLHQCGIYLRYLRFQLTVTWYSRFAYIEFADRDSVTTGQALDESLFRGRQIKVKTNCVLISMNDLDDGLSHVRLLIHMKSTILC